MKRVLILAGGTGGHVFPALAVAETLREQGFSVTWVGTRKGIEAKVVPAAGFPMEWITIQGLRRESLLDWVRLPFRLLYAMWQAFRVLRRIKPHVALAMGGFASGPGALAAALLRVPLVIHEQNATAGFTNRWLALVADQVLCGFPNAFRSLPGARHVGNPVRSNIFASRATEEPLLLGSRPLRLLVVGGSQGAAMFNKALPAAVALMPPELRPEVWHQTGRLQAIQTENAYRHIPLDARVTPFIDNMAAAYAWADVVVCRAGAMTIAELCAAGAAAILIPFPRAADDHQTANARFLADRDGAVLLPQDQCTPQRMAEILQGFARSPAVLQRMAQQARSLAVPDATARVARYCAEAAGA